MKILHRYAAFLLALLLFSCAPEKKELDTFDFGTVTFDEPFVGILSGRPSILVKSLDWPPYSWFRPDTLCLEKTFQLAFNEDCCRAGGEAVLDFMDESEKTVFRCNGKLMPKRRIKLTAKELNKESVNITCSLSPQLGYIDLTGGVRIYPTNIDEVNGVNLSRYNEIDSWHCRQKIGWPVMLWLLWFLTLCLLLVVIGCILFFLGAMLVALVSMLGFPTFIGFLWPGFVSWKGGRRARQKQEPKKDEWILLQNQAEINVFIPRDLLDYVANIRKRLQNNFVSSFRYYRHRYDKNKFKIESPGSNSKIILSGKNAYCVMGNRKGNFSMNEFLCNRKMLPNMTYHVLDEFREDEGIIRYGTDRYGRVVTLRTDLNDCCNELPKAVGRNSHYIVDACQMKDMVIGDQGGHLIAHDYNGPDDAINIVPMPRALNTGEWLRMESKVFKEHCLRPHAEVTMQIAYPKGRVTFRPCSITVTAGRFRKTFNYDSFEGDSRKTKGRRLMPVILMIAAILYDVSPVDILPDVLPVAGWIDDCLITIAAALNLILRR